MFSPPTKDDTLRLTQIVDPIAGEQYVIDPVNKLAHQLLQVDFARIPSAGRSRSACDTWLPPLARELGLHTMHWVTLCQVRPEWPMPEWKTTSLEPRTIDGLIVNGFRTELRYPRGTIRSDEDVVVVTEAWLSDDRKMILESKRDDSLVGSTVTRTVNYHPEDPNPDTFRPPADYRIQRETGPFRIDVSMPVSGQASR